MIPLVDQVARLCERTYDIDSGVVPLGRFVVGDEGHRRLCAARPSRRSVEHFGDGARLLLRREAGRWAAALYLPDALVAHLERHDPRRALDDDNVDEFATLVEEVDHLVTFAERAQAGADVSLLELEWHAAISKYLVLAHFAGRVTGRARLDEGLRAFLEHHVFLKGSFADPDPSVRARYERAHRLGWRFVRGLRGCAPVERIARLRRFHRASSREKLDRYSS